MASPGTVIRAAQLRAGDMFETLLTGAAGTCKERPHGVGYGVPVELWYPDGREVDRTLAPQVRVIYLGSAKAAA